MHKPARRIWAPAGAIDRGVWPAERLALQDCSATVESNRRIDGDQADQVPTERTETVELQHESVDLEGRLGVTCVYSHCIAVVTVSRFGGEYKILETPSSRRRDFDPTDDVDQVVDIERRVDRRRRR